jgi:hypothetical protein
MNITIFHLPASTSSTVVIWQPTSNITVLTYT